MRTFKLHFLLIVFTGPTNGPVLFCSLASVVVCNTAGGRAVQAVGRPTLHGGPVVLRHLVFIVFSVILASENQHKGNSVHSFKKGGGWRKDEARPLVGMSAGTLLVGWVTGAPAYKNLCPKGSHPEQTEE